MKEKQIIKKFQDIEILAKIIDGKIAMITNGEKEESFFSNNEIFFRRDECIFALYIILKEVDKQGGFNHLKNIDNKEDENIEKIYI